MSIPRGNHAFLLQQGGPFLRQVPSPALPLIGAHGGGQRAAGRRLLIGVIASTIGDHRSGNDLRCRAGMSLLIVEENMRAKGG